MDGLGFWILIVFIIIIIYSARKQGGFSNEKKEVSCCVLIGSVANLQSKTKTSTGSAVGRGLVGGALLGPAGAIIGAGTAKKKTTTKEVDSGERRFLVEYTDGTRSEETARVGTSRYQYLMSKLKMN